MKSKLSVFFAIVLFACNNANKPLTDADNQKNMAEVKNVVNTIIEAAETKDPVKMTSTFFDSPCFISFINGEYANYEQTVKKYPSLMSAYKTQKATILDEKYYVLDASTIVYTSKSKWVCKLQNDSIAEYDNCGMQLVLKKSHDDWKVLNWAETY